MSAVLADVAAGRLTADLLARAVIAAAQVYGDAPEEALTSEAFRGRRSLAAAASGVSRALRLELRPVCVPLGLNYDTARMARQQRRGVFVQAEEAVIRAMRYAGWRPEARESVVTAAAIPQPAPRVAPPPRLAPEMRPELSERPTRVLTADEEARDREAGRERLRRAAAKPAPWDAGGQSLSDRILEVLKDGGATSVGLATILDAKELAVSACLSSLHQAGRIAPGDIPPEGQRHRRWRMADGC